MSNTLTKTTKKLACQRLPLAVYREIVSHLRQIEGVDAGLLEQTSTEFDYLQSQVGGLWLEYSPDIKEEDKLIAILEYYENKYGSWVTIG